MANERRDQSTEATDTAGGAGGVGTGSGTASSLEARLAPIVGVFVVLSLLLGGGYLLVVTIW